jgi:hypothetical protein
MEIARVLKRGGTLILLESTFPSQISLVDQPTDAALASHCPGIHAFQDAIKWSLAQLAGRHGSGLSDHPIMDGPQVAAMVHRTPGLSGTSIQHVKIPIGDHGGKYNRHNDQRDRIRR